MIEAKAESLDAGGQPIRTSPPQWTPEEPQMVAVSPEQGDRVNITVKHSGESRLTLALQRLLQEPADQGQARRRDDATTSARKTADTQCSRDPWSGGHGRYNREAA